MTPKRNEFAALARLANAAFGAGQARMGALQQREADLRARIAALDADRKARALSLGEADPALLAGADLIWHRWIDRRRAALNLELARTLAEQAAARVELQRSFGRKEATAELLNRATAIARRTAERQADRMP